MIRLPVAHRKEDRIVPVAAFDAIRAELVARGRDVIVLRVEGADHGFQKEGTSLRRKGFEAS